VDLQLLLIERSLVMLDNFQLQFYNVLRNLSLYLAVKEVIKLVAIDWDGRNLTFLNEFALLS
jgi:hypothetical protein